MTLYLSRLTLNREAGNAALMPLLDPEGPGRLDANHRLLWSVFADGPDRRRDFLWRAEGGGRFMVLSARVPQPHALFAPPEVKPFAPDLAPGDRLTFALRANATKDRAAAKGKPSRRVDLVMDALRDVPKGARGPERMRVAQSVADLWLAAQGAAHGFAVESAIAEDYSSPRLGRGGMRLGILDLTGVIRVTDAASFGARLAQGFGRARAFGCGLMLIRRA